MHKSPLTRFLIRWFVCSFGLWVAAAIFKNQISYDNRAQVIIIAGLVLAIVNTIIKPLVVILSLPAILFSLGLFMLIINGFMIVVASWFYSGLKIQGFGSAILAGLVIGLVNYLVSTVLEEK